ncbi:WD40 repeat-like protein, partial [Rozella allomycis CSF55]
LALATETWISLWNLETYQKTCDLGKSGSFFHKDIIRDIKFSNNGDILATGSNDSKIILWHFESQKGSGKLSGHLGPVLSLMFSDDDRFLFSSSIDGKILIWDWDSGDII